MAALKVLSALDTARTQYYHFQAIIIAGMGLFADAYDLFCIPPIMKLLGRIYYENEVDVTRRYVIPPVVLSLMVGTALIGTAMGQVVFGVLGDRIGRRRVYGLSLLLMVLSSIGCGFSVCRTRGCVLVSLGIFRFLLGLGIGGDYPLSATIMSEFSNKKTRGGFIAAVFSMQGFGILASSAVTMIVCKIFNRHASKVPNDRTPKEADLAWRLILMFGAIPAGLTFYWRMKMPETARYTALVQQNVEQAARDMEKILDVSVSRISEDSLPQNQPSYPFFSKQFIRRHGRDLFICSLSWFIVDIPFYSSNLFQSKVYDHYLPLKHELNAYEEAYNVAKLQAILAACSTIPGYWATVFLIDRIGRVKIQMLGFLCMALVYFAIGIPYDSHWVDNPDAGFMVLYGLTFFFSNFGPNTTTFIVPAELFPARFRTTCHGISGAAGKVGAVIGAVGFAWVSHSKKEYGYPKGIGIRASLVIMGIVCIIGVLVTYLFMLETKNRSLEENEKEHQTQQPFILRFFYDKSQHSPTQDVPA